MRLGKDLENKPIVSVSDGQILGRTKDIYLDQQLTQLAGLFVGTEGVIRRKDRLIPNERIVLFGVDVILVRDSDVITTGQALPETDHWHRLSQLHGKQVFTPGGTKLATLDDITLDELGAISGFTLARVYVTGPLEDKRFIPREVVVDPFINSDDLLIDFPALEAMYMAQEPVTEKEPEPPVDLQEEQESDSEIKESTDAE